MSSTRRKISRKRKRSLSVDNESDCSVQKRHISRRLRDKHYSRNRSRSNESKRKIKFAKRGKYRGKSDEFYNYKSKYNERCNSNTSRCGERRSHNLLRDERRGSNFSKGGERCPYYRGISYKLEHRQRMEHISMSESESDSRRNSESSIDSHAHCDGERRFLSDISSDRYSCSSSITLSSKCKPEKRRRILPLSSSSDEEVMAKHPTVDNVVPAENGANESNVIGEINKIKIDYLELLGESNGVSPTGPKIDDKVADIWQQICKKGLAKESKELLIKKYLFPENCQMLMAPKLNPEIKLAIQKNLQRRDFVQSASQNQLGLSISAIGKILTHIMNEEQLDTEAMKKLVFECLSDAGKLLTDLHHEMSLSR